MWFFSYFFGSYVITSTASFLYDVYVDKFKHINRTPQQVKQCAKDMMPIISVNLFGVTLPYSLFIERNIKDVERNEYGFFPNFLLVYMIADFLTYFMHRLFHHPKLYFLHKMHHEYVYPLAMGALYAHPIDYFMINLATFTAPIFILYPADYIIKIIIVLAVSLTTIQSHGSYTFFDDAHLKHHKFYKVNYGLGIMDRICGTFK
jgi:sterol desaturase/sphingolipid hydroxylase (fatty acid hydroxylase superfamily)